MNEFYNDPTRPKPGPAGVTSGTPNPQSLSDSARTDPDQTGTKAHEAKEQVQEKTQEAQAQTKQKAAEVADRTKQEAAKLSKEIKAKARSTTENQKQELAKQIEGVATALHQAATQFEQQHQDMLTYWTDQAAASLDKMGASLRDRDVETVLQQFQDFARRQPGVVLGGAVVLGFLGSRFFKSTALRSEGDYASHDSSSHSNPPQESQPTGSVPPAEPTPTATAGPAGLHSSHPTPRP